MSLDHVLIIDDDRDVRRVAQLALETVGKLRVSVAASGEEGIAVARELHPDIVLLDMMMPGLDGPETLALLRADPATASLPVVFLTARGRPLSPDQLQVLDVRGVLKKPFDPLCLAQQLRDLLGEARL